MSAHSLKKAWIVFTEIALCGFLVRSGQIMMILLAFKFNQIFINPAQIIFLPPIAITIVVILGLLALIEIECGRFMNSLDSRLKSINLYLKGDDNDTVPNYLEKSFLPIAINIASIPIIFVFLCVKSRSRISSFWSVCVLIDRTPECYRLLIWTDLRHFTWTNLLQCQSIQACICQPNTSQQYQPTLL